MLAIERSTKPPSDAYGYYFGGNGVLYTGEEYRPEFSDGRVSESDVQNLLQEINSGGYVQALCAWEMLFVPIILGCMGGSIAILASNMVQTETTLTRTEITTGTIPRASAIAGMVVMGVLGFASMVAICIFSFARQRKYELSKAYHKKKVLSKHQTEIFGPKDCNLRMSPYGGYIAIEFNWKPRPVMAVVPQGHAVMPLGGAGAIFPNVGMNVYQSSQVAPVGYGAGQHMYNQPPPTLS